MTLNSIHLKKTPLVYLNLTQMYILIIDTIVLFFLVLFVECSEFCGVCSGSAGMFAECTSCLPGYEKTAVACVGRIHFHCWNVMILILLILTLTYKSSVLYYVDHCQSCLAHVYSLNCPIIEFNSIIVHCPLHNYSRYNRWMWSKL